MVLTIDSRSDRLMHRAADHAKCHEPMYTDNTVLRMRLILNSAPTAPLGGLSSCLTTMIVSQHSTASSLRTLVIASVKFVQEQRIDCRMTLIDNSYLSNAIYRCWFFDNHWTIDLLAKEPGRVGSEPASLAVGLYIGTYTKVQSANNLFASWSLNGELLGIVARDTAINKICN